MQVSNRPGALALMVQGLVCGDGEMLGGQAHL